MALRLASPNVFVVISNAWPNEPVPVPQADPLLVKIPSGPTETHDVAPAREPTEIVPLVRIFPATLSC